MFVRFGLILLMSACAAQSHQLIGFDVALASSIHSTSSALFGAEQALAKGSGYWCSSGSAVGHASVSWVGISNARRWAKGLVVDWAYAPGAVKVLTSADGASFEEAIPWRATSQSAVAFKESFIFVGGRNVKAASILMREPRPWKYFGINSVSLLADIGAFMLISGMPAPSGEHCVVGSESGVHLQPCLSAIAGGDGREVFTFQEGRVTNVASSSCLTLLGGGRHPGGKLALMASCEDFGVNSFFSFSTSGQLMMPLLGDVCVTSGGADEEGGLFAADCSGTGDKGRGHDKFFLQSVGHTSLNAASLAKDLAQILAASRQRLAKLTGTLLSIMGSVTSCSALRSGASGALVTQVDHRGLKLRTFQPSKLDQEVDAVLQVDKESLAAALMGARSALQKINV